MPMKTPKGQQLVNKELTHKLFSRVEEVCRRLVIYKILLLHINIQTAFSDFLQYFSPCTIWQQSTFNAAVITGCPGLSNR